MPKDGLVDYHGFAPKVPIDIGSRQEWSWGDMWMGFHDMISDLRMVLLACFMSWVCWINIFETLDV